MKVSSFAPNKSFVFPSAANQLIASDGGAAQTAAVTLRVKLCCALVPTPLVAVIVIG